MVFSVMSRDSRRSESRRGALYRPSNVIVIDRLVGKGIFVWIGIMLGSRTPVRVFAAVTVAAHCYRDEVLLNMLEMPRKSSCTA